MKNVILKKEEINFLKCIDTTSYEYLGIDFGRETMNFYCNLDKYEVDTFGMERFNMNVLNINFSALETGKIYKILDLIEEKKKWI